MFYVICGCLKLVRCDNQNHQLLTVVRVIGNELCMWNDVWLGYIYQKANCYQSYQRTRTIGERITICQ